MSVRTSAQAATFRKLIQDLASHGVDFDQARLEATIETLMNREVSLQGDTDAAPAGGVVNLEGGAETTHVHIIMNAHTTLNMADVSDVKVGDRMTVHVQEDDSTGYNLIFGTNILGVTLAIGVDAIVLVELVAVAGNFADPSAASWQVVSSNVIG